MMLEVKLNTQQITRIFSKVRVDPSTGCWNWIGFLSGGYGNVRYAGNLERAHRVVYAWAVGPIPKGAPRNEKRGHIPQIDHVVCQNTRCCNPVHLELVPQRVNILRGRGICATYARMTHCSEGHPLPPEPNAKCGKGLMTRRCMICVKKQQRANYLKRKERGYYK
jgi:hypothetical protein